MNKYLKVSHFCKKRMIINRPLLREMLRQAETREKLEPDNEILNEAFIIQSVTYHNALFNTIKPKLRLDREREKRLLSIRTKYGIENLSDKFDKVLQIPKQLSLRDKEEKEKKDQRDKRRREQMNIDEVETKQEMDLEAIDEDVKEVTKLYFDKKLDEDELRIKLHQEVVDRMESNLESACKEADNVQSYYIVDRFKNDMLEYINFTRSEKFREESLSYAKTRDNMRIDFGLVISRAPIFLSVNDEDMEFGKYRRNTFRKYFFDTDKVYDDIESMNDVTTSYWDTLSNIYKANGDNKPKLRKLNEKGEYDFYCPDSKHYNLVSPYVDDKKSIQYAPLERTYMYFKNKHTGEMEFPTIPLHNGDLFNDVKYRLFLNLTKENFKIFFYDHHPSFMITRDFHDYEKDDPKNKDLRGVRTYYYQAFHFRGRPEVVPNAQHCYDDFIFATKRETNKIISKPYYNTVIGSLQQF